MRRFLTVIALIACAALSAHAQGLVVGSGNFSPIVQDLDKSTEFYHNLGIDVPGAAGPRAFEADPALLNFLGTPTAQVRYATARIPGSTMGVEMVEFKDIDRKPVQPRLQDPGAVRLILLVRDIKKTPGRVVQDPDGHFIEFVQPDPLPETTAPATSNIIGARFGLTVASLDQTMRLYRDVLGLQFTGDHIASIPGSKTQVEFTEYKDAGRKPINARIQDPGATRFQLRVSDSDVAVKALKNAGGTVITTGGDGGPINMRNLRVAVVREPNNLFLVIMR